MKKRFFIYDEKGMDIFIDMLKAETEEKAIEAADSEWDRLTKVDRNHRKAFDLCCVNEEDLDEDGNVDLGIGYDIVKSYKG